MPPSLERGRVAPPSPSFSALQDNFLKFFLRRNKITVNFSAKSN